MAGQGAATSSRRPGLDGLRAVAVTAVVAYHFGGGASSPVAGGFLGVDLFFVLSGYLITGLLLDEHARSGRIDLLGFWIRRIRRLLPALVLVLLAVCAWVWWFASPQTWQARRVDLLWTLPNLANWHFVAAGEDYFAAYSGASPLRHAWSLAIEEQFYLVWPLVVAGCLLVGRRLGRRLPGRRLLTVVCVVAAGLSVAALAMTFEPGSPSRAYYGTDGRVQELLVGALLALAVRSAVVRRSARRAAPARWLPGATQVAGLVLVVVACLVASDSRPAYYRGGALVFSLVVAGLIWAVETDIRTPARALLTSRPLVALGRISYGVYLWHWPIAVFLPLAASASVAETVGRQLLRVGLTLAVAVASYRLVEQPVLQGRAWWVGRSRLRLVAVAATAFVLVGCTAVAATHVPNGLGAQLADSGDRPCPGEDVDHLVACVAVDSGPGAPITLLLGDSTARALAPGLDALARREGSTWVQAAWQRCTPTGLLVVPNGQGAPDAAATSCARQARASVSRTLTTYRPQTVLVTEFWTHHQALLVDGRLLQPGTPAHAVALRRAYLRLVDEVTAAGGRTVLLELPPPGLSVGPYVASGRPAGRATAPYGGAFVEGYDAMLRDVAAARPGRAVTVSVTDVLCPADRCDAVQGDQLVRYDGVHVTAAYARRLVPVVVARARAALSSSAS